VEKINSEGGTGEEEYRKYFKYLTESTYWFERDVIGVSQFLLSAKPFEQSVSTAA